MSIQQEWLLVLGWVPPGHSRGPCFCNYRFALASHFFWGLWSIVQAKISSIEFGYMVGVRGVVSPFLSGGKTAVYVGARW